MLFSYLMTVVYLVIILCTLFICTSSPLYTHTLIRSLSDDPGFVRPDIGRFVSIVQVYDETVRFANSWSFSLFDSGILIFLPSYYFLILVISDSVVIPVIIYMISCVDAYMWYCSNHDLLQLGFIACFGLLKPYRVYVRYFSCVYESLTRVASSLQRILGSGVWQDFS